MDIGQITHDVHVEVIAEKLRKKYPNDYVETHLEYRLNPGGEANHFTNPIAGEVDIYRVKVNGDVVFYEFKTKDTPSNFMKAKTQYNRFQRILDQPGYVRGVYLSKGVVKRL